MRLSNAPSLSSVPTATHPCNGLQTLPPISSYVVSAPATGISIMDKRGWVPGIIKHMYGTHVAPIAGEQPERIVVANVRIYAPRVPIEIVVPRLAED